MGERKQPQIRLKRAQRAHDQLCATKSPQPHQQQDDLNTIDQTDGNQHRVDEAVKPLRERAQLRSKEDLPQKQRDKTKRQNLVEQPQVLSTAAVEALVRSEVSRVAKRLGSFTGLPSAISA